MKSYILLMFIMLVWGFNVPAIKYLTTESSPIAMTSIRIFIASITVFIILTILGITRALKKKEWFYVIMGSLLNVVIHHAFMSLGVSLTSSANAGLIIGAGPIMTAVLGMLLLKNLPTAIQWIGFVLGLSGISVAILFNDNELSVFTTGDVFVFVSILSQAFSFLIISKVAKTIDPRLLTAYMFLVGSVILGLVSFIVEPVGFASIPLNNLNFWMVLFASAILGTALGHMLYNNTIPKVGAAKSAIFINFNTLFAVIGSALLLQESITYAHWIGLVLIIFGVLLGSGTLESLLGKKERKNMSFELDYFSLKGKTALVTGARTGIGQAISVGLAAAGAHVILVGHQDNMQETQEKITQLKGTYETFLIDLSDVDNLGKKLSPILEKYKIDILVNNAGVIYREPAAAHNVQEWNRVLDVNINSVFMLCQTIGQQMIENGAGKIINIASLLSFQGGINVPSYTASKHAVAGLTKALANEWASRGVQVNAIAPGYISTNNTEALRNDEERNKSILERIPAARWGQADDLAGTAVFLASRASDYVSGHVLVVDGGWMGR